MPSINQYTAEDGLRWERYAEAVRRWLNNEGPHPGEAPEGYNEVFRRRQQRYAPHPDDFPNFRPAPYAPAMSTAPAMMPPPQPGTVTSPGVAMSEGAFGHLLQHQSTWIEKL
ncbi:hypothetical protein GLOTRDRAFT_134498, partial [Gloeophyllum trabeum ATCC 11539]